MTQWWLVVVAQNTIMSYYTNLVGALSKNWLRNQQVKDLCCRKPWRLWLPQKWGGGSELTMIFLPAYGNKKSKIIDTALQPGRSLFLCSCIYPKLKATTAKRAYLLTDTLEPTKRWYAIAKNNRVKACQAKTIYKDYVNDADSIYGTHDNFDLNRLTLFTCDDACFRRRNSNACNLWEAEQTRISWTIWLRRWSLH
jgi:hypothetical protein